MGMRRETLLASAARTASGDSGILNVGADQYVGAVILLDVTAQSGTSPTLNVYIQQELPDATFDDLGAFTQTGAATGKKVIRVVGGSNEHHAAADATLAAGTVRNGPIGGKWRVKWVIAGATPSYTFSVKADLYN